ncbi:unnamed protein product [Adineta ricciae]|uniref:Uncharacterized protein n=1 Tax=Adineta ricciae TaxID=249248 RepID=A0A814WP15_ADIRI|nr:unnamed protein product [Adineta ricciae]
MSDNNLSGRDEALLILEYLENERMSKTFLSFLDESKHLHELRSRLYTNYQNAQQQTQQNSEHESNDAEVNDFQTFFNLSKQLISQLSNEENEKQMTCLSVKSSNDLFLDDFLNDLISQTPPMDYQHDLPDTPLIAHDNNDMNSIDQLFAVQHNTLPSHEMISPMCNTPTRVQSYTKCIVVTQDFLQSMYNQQSTITTNNNTNNNNLSLIQKPKRRRRRLKAGKENNHQQRKIMPRASPDHR